MRLIGPFAASLAGTIQTGLAKAQLDGLLGQIESIIGNVTADLGAAVPVITTPPVATAAPSLPITPEDITALINTVVGFLTVRFPFGSSLVPDADI